MTIAKLEFFPISIPYTHREVSYQIKRDGITNVLVKVTADDGIVGWGEACSGANTQSVEEALRSMVPFVVGRSPWESESIREELWLHGLWMYRKGTASFAYAGIDMALWDICGKACGQPLYNLFGGKVRNRVNYFYYLSQGSNVDLTKQCRQGLRLGFHVFYLKVGINIEAEMEMVRTVRETIGPQAKLRLDANTAWTVNEAVRNLARLAAYKIDFIEQPVKADPLTNLQEIRSRTPIAISCNEGMWSAEDAYRRIVARVADVYCFSPYWVGSLVQYQRICQVAHFEGLQVVGHTHGETGIFASAAHHILLTLPNVTDGNQHTHNMADDVLKEPLPIAAGPDWGVPEGVGLCVDVDEEKVQKYHELYRSHGQFLPYDSSHVGAGVAK